ncbi:ribonuclease BN [Taibaiella sp. KBW10]|uniref:YihY/virulence factor BrkB family protein n=1 Tax=Taibaiella sp. KBW10 TaxID=2153357 RepID=UPI000F59EF98|nr:YihY/virulence factor BrkB family protein [Taibaiella sp. KBW10]RQO32293.1 ribonuclease BN [Taibaiella sp. KBW10]
MSRKATATLKKYWRILLNAGIGFADDRASKLSAALAYNTIFSLPPMLLLIIIIGGTFYGQQALEGKLFAELQHYIGSSTAFQIQEVMSKINFQKNSGIATVISIIVLLIGATGIFVEIQDSLNLIWGVRAKAKKGFIKLLISRAVSFTMIIGLGFLLLVSLVLNAVLLGFSHFIITKLPFIPVELVSSVNTTFVFLILTFLFMVIFKMLPDVKIRWLQVLPGAIVTTLLFFLGKYLIGLYISSSTVASLYGAAGSIIILLLWIYYSALILYFGAEFTRAFVEEGGEKIKPTAYAEYSDRLLLKAHLEEERKEA